MELHKEVSNAAMHLPVLSNEVVDYLNVRDGGCYVDGTFGMGGYSDNILARAKCRLFAIDRDPAALGAATKVSKKYKDKFSLIEGCFGSMDTLLLEYGVEQVDAVVLDLGVSSLQLDDPRRGFSFRFDGPLDMRMGRDGITAADVVNSMCETELANLIFSLGEERFSRHVSRAIANERSKAPIRTTKKLADIVRRVIPYRKGGKGIDPATRTFQALRIYVNDELGQLDRGLEAAERLLVPGGRLAVVAFHSLEDRRVKNFLKQREGHLSNKSRHLPAGIDNEREPSFKNLTKRPIRPKNSELETNPRSRSARLRVAERTEAPPWKKEG